MYIRISRCIYPFEFVVRTCTYVRILCVLPYFSYNYPSCLNFFHLCARFVFVRTSMYMPIIYFAVFLPCISHFSASVIYERLCEFAHAFTRSFVVCFACLHTFQCIYTDSCVSVFGRAHKKEPMCAAHTVGCTRKMLTFETYI